MYKNERPSICQKGEEEGERERYRECWRNVIKSVYGVLSLPHKSRTTCSLEVITPGSRDILHVNSESLHLKLGVKIPFPPIDKLNHLQADGIWCCWCLHLQHWYSIILLQKRGLWANLTAWSFGLVTVNFIDHLTLAMHNPKTYNVEYTM